MASLTARQACVRDPLILFLAGVACNIGTPGGTGQGISTLSDGTASSATESSSSTTITTAESGLSGSGTTSGSGDSTTPTGGAPPDRCGPREGFVLGERAFPGSGMFNNPMLEYPRELAIHGERLAVAWNSEDPVGCEVSQRLHLGLELNQAVGNDGVVAVYNLAFQHTMSHVFVGTDVRQVMGVAFDAKGNLLVAGLFDGQVEIPTHLGVYEGATVLPDMGQEFSAGFVTAFDPAGKRLPFSPDEVQAFYSGANFEVVPIDVAIAPAGGFAVTGYYTGNLAFAQPDDGCPLLPFKNNKGTFVAFFDSGFKLDEVRCISPVDPEDGRVLGLRADFAGDGSLIVAGDFQTKFAFAGEMVEPVEPVEPASNLDAFVAAWSAAHEELWVVSCGSGSVDVFRQVTVASDGRVLVAGSVGDKARCSVPRGIDESTHERAFVGALKLDPRGKPQWSFERLLASVPDLASKTHSEFFAVQVDPCGDVIVGGYAIGPPRWDDEGEEPWDDETALDQKEDIIVARLSADGTPLWGRRWGSPGRDWSEGLALDAFGGIYAAVQFDGPINELAWPEPGEPKCVDENGSSPNVGLIHLSP